MLCSPEDRLRGPAVPGTSSGLAPPASRPMALPQGHGLHNPAVLLPMPMWAGGNLMCLQIHTASEVIVDYMNINITENDCHCSAYFFSSQPCFDGDPDASVELFPH